MNLVFTDEDVQRAVDFAREAHGDQKYGELSYVDGHLIPVKDFFVENFNGVILPIYVQAAILHDIGEDAPDHMERIRDVFDWAVYTYVSLVTDAPGANRLERQLQTYWKTRDSDVAVAIKLSDRYVNMHSCLLNKDARTKMYVREYERFKFALYRPCKATDGMWTKLDDLYKELKKVS